MEPRIVHWLCPGDPTVTLDSIDGPVTYPACQRPWCLLPIGTMTGSPMRLYGLGTGWTSYECTEGHQYAYQPQGKPVSHAVGGRKL